MSTKTYSNENTVSLWANTSKGGKEYLKGKVYVGNVAYDIVLFPNENVTSESQPVFRGSIELPKAK
ncbi:MAG: hypothetical protein ACRCX2_20465 [Paraclostridium sp.]